MDRTPRGSQVFRTLALAAAATATLPPRLVWLAATRVLDRAGRVGIDNAAGAVESEELLRSALDGVEADIVQRPTFEGAASVH